MKDIRDIASELDEVIEKGKKLEEKANEIKKSLSFDPTRPVDMSSVDSVFYSPYRQMADGTYAPYPVDHWAGMGKPREAYRTTEEFYRMAGGDGGEPFLNLQDVASVRPKFARSMGWKKKFEILKKSVSVGSKGMSIGTIHTWKDGNKYRKINQNEWELVSEGGRGKRVDDPESHKHIEKDAGDRTARIKKVKNELEKRKVEDVFKKKKDEEYAHYTPEEHDVAERKHKKEVEDANKEYEESYRTRDEKRNKKAIASREENQMMSDYHFQAATEKRKKEEAGEKESDNAKQENESFDSPESVLKAKGDAGLPTNKLDNIEAFTKPGVDITIDDCANFLKQFEKDFQETRAMDKTLREFGASHFCCRLKAKKSLFNKMKTSNYGDRSLNTVGDAIGARALSESLSDQKRVLEAIKKKYDIVEMEDAVTNPKSHGYRAIHITFRTTGGKIGELQIKTHHQQIFSGFAHDSIYKGKKEVKEHPEVNEYVNKLSEYLYNLDKAGHGDAGKHKEDESNRPKEPQIMIDNNIEFPWDEIEEFGAKALAARPEVRHNYYTVIRDENRKNFEVKEFSTFKQAKTYRDDMYKEGKVEIPIAFAPSMEEFMETFSEYRPDNWAEVKELREKTKRKLKDPEEPQEGYVPGKQVGLASKEVEHVLKSGKYALISAGRNWRSSKELSMSPDSPEFKKRTEELKKELISKGYSFTDAQGYSSGGEPAFLVMCHDAEREEMIELGRKFNQDSVVYGENGAQERHYTTGELVGKVAVGKGYDENVKDNEEHTRLKTSDGKELSFKLNFDTKNLKSKREVIKAYFGLDDEEFETLLKSMSIILGVEYGL
jgi:ppGpp synthetase/RelA/SpoT-type nucleotidyltranferase